MRWKRARTAMIPAVAMLALGGAAAPTAGGTAPAEDFTVTVDLSDRMLYVKRGGETLREYEVAVGKDAHPTPTGEFRIRRIIWNPRWVPPNAEWARGRRARAPGDPRNPMGRAKLFFREPDYYIHGTSDEESLGSAASHGCVRMRNAEVMDLARIVMENGGAPRSDSWFQRVINHFRSSQHVTLSQPVTVTVQE
jgi:lipoprotein-anchoring transpeptidase ErfK/SrfK